MRKLSRLVLLLVVFVSMVVAASVVGAQEGEATILDRLADPLWTVRLEAAESLEWEMQLEEDVITALGSLLVNDPVYDVRQAAGYALQGRGDHLRPVIPQLAQALRDEDDAVRSISAGLLRELRGAAEPAIPAVLRVLPEESVGPTRASLIEVLGAAGAGTDEQKQLIRGFLGDMDGMARRAAVWVVGTWAMDDEETLTALTPLVLDSEEMVREETAEVLQVLGTPVIPHLIGLLWEQPTSAVHGEEFAWDFSGSFSEGDFYFTGDPIGNPWVFDENDYTAGFRSIHSPSIDHYESTAINLDVDMDEAFLLIFDYQVSSEEYYDELLFLVNDSVWGSWSGETGWQTAQFSFQPGYYTLSWQYEKDINTSIGMDRAWIDNIRFQLLQ